MNSQTFQAATEEEMIALGELLAALLPSRALVFLQGDLGAGKTTLVKGIAKGLHAAMPEEVSSPTFTLIHEYGDPARVYHIDLYRLDSPRQLEALGLDEIFEREAVVVVEWPEKFARWLPRAHLTVKISASAGARAITVESARESLTPH
ncbi:MAG: tRNA (adenosine(37)-N6)-threonylcarbamoyltransferase complex ATPase subunit type 1 TsaE [Bryobacterales bacterium]|nr:tRNA (adenosine(37)-N6)-threonylcarbamoyltransferase complex ATPase subunit type 1 TsaE [Bryobacterales bacterium]